MSILNTSARVQRLNQVTSRRVLRTVVSKALGGMLQHHYSHIPPTPSEKNNRFTALISFSATTRFCRSRKRPPRILSSTIQTLPPPPLMLPPPPTPTLQPSLLCPLRRRQRASSGCTAATAQTTGTCPLPTRGRVVFAAAAAAAAAAAHDDDGDDDDDQGHIAYFSHANCFILLF